MSKLRITVACGGYDRTLALRDGTVKVDGIDLNYISLEPEEIFWRSFQFEDFDGPQAVCVGCKPVPAVEEVKLSAANIVGYDTKEVGRTRRDLE